jgi:hypothetical protein
MEVAMRITALLIVAATAASLAGQALAQEATARKGTRNYVPPEPVSSESLEKATAPHTFEGCMASWDAKTHISKSDWRKICERDIRSRAAHSGQ